MTAADRVKAIKVISRTLSKSTFSEIDVILAQFGVSAISWNSPDRVGYVQAAISSAPSATLLELCACLESLESEVANSRIATPEAENRIWTPNCFRLFLSHRSIDKGFVGEVKTSLKAFSITGFVAHEDIEPTKEWIEEIRTALSSCHALAAFLTPGFPESDWTDQEVGYCVSRKIPLLPIRLGIDPYGFLGSLQGLPGSKDPADIANQIFQVLSVDSRAGHTLALALTPRFIKSRTFEKANANFDLIDRITTGWTPELLAEIEAASKSNFQIAGAWNLAGKVSAFISRNSQ